MKTYNIIFFSHSEAKKGNTKKSAKPRRWESFKNTFAINARQRSPSPAPETREQKKTTKKSFMGRFKVSRRGGATPKTDARSKNRPLSFTSADQKQKDTLDVFAQFDVSRSLPASPVAKRKKKQSVASVETATPISPMSLTSGSPFTPGGITSDSQSSTPAHVTSAPTSNTAGQEIQVRVDVEDTEIPVIIEPNEGAVTQVEGAADTIKSEKATTTSTTPVILVEDQSESPAKPVEPSVVAGKEDDNSAKPAEPVEKEGERQTDPVMPAIVVEKESPTKPAEPVEPAVVVEKEDERPAEPVEPAVVVEKEDESPTKPAEPVEPAVVVEKEDESLTKPDVPVEPSAIPEKVAESEALPAEDEEERPAEADVPVEKEVKEGDTPAEPVAVATEAGDVTRREPVKPVEPVRSAEKESEVESPNEQVPEQDFESKLQAEEEETSQSEFEPHSHIKTPDLVVEKEEETEIDEAPTEPGPDIKANEVEKEGDEKPVIPAKPVEVTENEAQKTTRERPALPTKPATVTEAGKKPALPVKPATVKANEEAKKISDKTAESFVPKYLKDRNFQWDKIREVLETAPESMETGSYHELPPEDASWTDQPSSMEQLRAFLVVCP